MPITSDVRAVRTSTRIDLMKAWSVASFLAFIAIVCASTTQAGHVPPSARPSDGPTLDQTPLPDNAVLVICENLKQALGQMQPGSVILSPARYKELTEELARLRAGASQPGRERLFAACRISGSMRPQAPGVRAAAELKIELEFKTEAPNSRVAIPLRGLPILDAKLDGQTPLWTSADSGLALIVPEAKSHVLTLSGLAPLSGSSLERKLILEQLPPAAATSFSLQTNEPAVSAQAKGHGAWRVEAAEGGGSRFGDEALGVVNRLEVAWRPAVPVADGAPTLTVIGDQKYRLDAASLEADVRLRLELAKGRLTELTLRLPGEPQDLHAELLPADDRRAEPPEVTSAGEPNLWRLRLKEPLTADGSPATIRLRWSQRHAGKPGTRISLCQAEATAPAGAWRSGVLTVLAPADLQIRLEEPDAPRAERRDAVGDARGLSFSFRYGPQPLRLAAVLAAPSVAPAVEARWSHEATIGLKRLRLASELELTRVAGAELEELNLQLPPGWTVDPKLLQNPFVRDFEPPTPDGKMRVLLASRLPSPLKLRFECETSGGAERAQFGLPRLSGASSLPGRLVRWIRRPGRLALNAEGVTVRLEFGAQGLFDDEQRPPELEKDLAVPVAWRLADEAEIEPLLSLRIRQRLPLIRREAKLLLHRDRCCCDEIWSMRWLGTGPTELRLRGPKELREPPRLELLGADEGAAAQPLQVRPTGAQDGVSEWEVRLPPNLASPIRLHVSFAVSFPQELGPGSWAAPSLAPLGCEAEGEPILEARCALPLRLLPPMDGAWTALPQSNERLGTLRLRGGDGSAPLTLQLDDSAAAALPFDVPRMLIEATPRADGEWDIRARARLDGIRAASAVWMISCSPQRLRIQEARIGDIALAADQWRLRADGESARLETPLPIQALGASAMCDLKFRLKAGVSRSWRLDLPAIRFAAPASAQTVRWRVAGLEGEALLALSPGLRAEEVGFRRSALAPAEATHCARAMGLWVDQAADARHETLGAEEPPAFAFVQTGPLETAQLWHIPRHVAALAASLGFLGLTVLLLIAPRRGALLLGLGALGGAVGAAWLAPQGLASAAWFGWPGLAAAMALFVWHSWRERRGSHRRDRFAFVRAADQRPLPFASTESGI